VLEVAVPTSHEETEQNIEDLKRTCVPAEIRTGHFPDICLALSRCIDFLCDYFDDWETLPDMNQIKMCQRFVIC
jgi:hypothetical protein